MVLPTPSVPRLAYGSLHEASTILLPAGCPHCRLHLARHCEKAEPSDCTAVAMVPPPHCDICELSARVVMRGVGLMERDKDYDNAFHYLNILLQVIISFGVAVVVVIVVVALWALLVVICRGSLC